jgi:hypothetical protein
VQHLLLQHAFHFLKAKHNALKEDHHAPWEEDSSAASVAVQFESVFAFSVFDIESLAVLTQAPCPTACAHRALVP